MDALAANEEDRRTWPIFVVGCHRSGTTLVRFILDTHPAIACPPEAKLVGALHEMSLYPQLRGGLLAMGVTPRELFTQYARMTNALMGAYAARHHKRRWADKTPNYYRILPFINEVFGGRALFLFVVRHPFDTITSLINFVDRGAGGGDDPELAQVRSLHGVGPFAWARYWAEVYGSVNLFRSQFPTTSRLLRYEDLVQTPEESLRPVFEFLGEDFDPGMLRSVFSNVHDPGMEDYKIRYTTRIHDQSVHTWKDWTPEMAESLWVDVGRFAEPLGYRPDAPLPAPMPLNGAGASQNHR